MSGVNWMALLCAWSALSGTGLSAAVSTSGDLNQQGVDFPRLDGRAPLVRREKKGRQNQASLSPSQQEPREQMIHNMLSPMAEELFHVAEEATHSEGEGKNGEKMMSHHMVDGALLAHWLEGVTPTQGLWTTTISEERIRKYMSALYHEDLERGTTGWREKWNETEMVYSHIGHLNANDFPPGLHGKWEEFAGGSREAGRYMIMNVKRQLVPSDTWVEVIRKARKTDGSETDTGNSGEGKAWAGGSCWFYQFKGSGVWLNVGKTKAFDGDDAFAVEQMGKEGPAFQIESQIDGSSDRVYTAYANHKGLDTIQTSASKKWDGNLPELIYFGGSCRDTTIRGGCIPGLELRTGVHANLPCICKENGVLNCDGSPEPALARRTKWDESPLPAPAKFSHKAKSSKVFASLRKARPWNIFASLLDKGPPPTHVIGGMVIILLLVVVALVLTSSLSSQHSSIWTGQR